MASTQKTGEYLGRNSPHLAAGRPAGRLVPYISPYKHSTAPTSCASTRLPLIARQLLREQDSLQMTELHPSDFPLLRAEFQER
ncbi:23S rRNA (adenine(2030)-N(6))-methyltransferase RlmJ [Shigella flexneri]